MIYGYCRISTPKQDITRQLRNIEREYPNAVMVQEVYTGTSTERPKWKWLKSKVKQGDTIIFDSVSRMSRDSEDGYREYMELYDRGINLVFLKQRFIDSDVYRMQSSIEMPKTESIADILINAMEEYTKALARVQIQKAFEQSELEVQALRVRTKEGLQTAKDKGKKIGRQAGVKVETEKAKRAKKIIKAMSKDFKGDMKDSELIELIGISSNSFYKYKKELKQNGKTNK